MDAKLTIFVLDRGIVLVGVPAQDPADWFRLVLTHCATVRRWGTKSGLGQLAAEGPQAQTVLDVEPDGTAVNKRYIMRELSCTERAWSKYLNGK